jgi:hypothetical protein
MGLRKKNTQPIIAGQRLGKPQLRQQIRNNKTIVVRRVSYAVRVLSKEP